MTRKGDTVIVIVTSIAILMVSIAVRWSELDKVRHRGLGPSAFNQRFFFHRSAAVDWHSLWPKKGLPSCDSRPSQGGTPQGLRRVSAGTDL